MDIEKEKIWKRKKWLNLPDEEKNLATELFPTYSSQTQREKPEK